MKEESTTARLERLEASVAHLERLVDQLNEALIEQGRRLGRLEKRMDHVAELSQARADASPAPPIERPPHYGR